MDAVIVKVFDNLVFVWWISHYSILKDICLVCVHFPLGKRGYMVVLPNGILTKSQLQGRGFQGRGNINF